MRNSSLALVLTISLLCTTAPLSSQTLPLEERVFILSKTYESIPVQFAHWRDASFGPDRLDSVYRSFLRRAIVTENRKDFGQLMQEFIALLNNTHSWYYDSKVLGATLPLGFTTLYINGRWTVKKSAIQGLSPGDVLLKIDGRTLDEQYQKEVKYISASTDLSKHELLTSSLSLTLPDEFELEVEPRGGGTKHFAVHRSALPKLTEPNATEARWIVQDKVGYIMIPSFRESRFEESAIDQLNHFRHAAVLIIDIRGNRGGNTPQQLTRAVMNKPYRWWTEGSPLTVGLFRFYLEARPGNAVNDYFRNAQLVWQSGLTEPDSGAFSRNLIILVDRYTGSASEDFTVQFKDNGRALIVGETTNGSSGQPYMFSFGDGIRVGIGTKREYMPNGAEFEGVGIQPDFVVPYEREDLYSGKDRGLEKAMTEANRLLPGK